MPVIIETLGTVRKSLGKELEKQEIKRTVRTILMSALLKENSKNLKRKNKKEDEKEGFEKEQFLRRRILRKRRQMKDS